MVLYKFRIINIIIIIVTPVVPTFDMRSAYPFACANSKVGGTVFFMCKKDDQNVIIASVAFLIWAVVQHKQAQCLTV